MSRGTYEMALVNDVSVVVTVVKAGTDMSDNMAFGVSIGVEEVVMRLIAGWLKRSSEGS